MIFIADNNHSPTCWGFHTCLKNRNFTTLAKYFINSLLTEILPVCVKSLNASFNLVRGIVVAIYQLLSSLKEEKKQYVWRWGISLEPNPPSTLQEERGSGEYSTTFLHFCWNFSGTIWLADVAIISPVLGWLPYHKPLSFSHHTFTNLLKPNKQLQRLSF